MSAQITYEHQTIEQAACYVGIDIGYVYCAACYHAGVSRICYRSRDLTGMCDLCGVALTESIELVDVVAEIEWMTAKIF